MNYRQIELGTGETIFLYTYPEIKKTMNRQNIIVFIQGERVETYGNLKKCCEMEGLKYWTLSRLKFPIRKDGYVIHKTLFK